MNAFDVYGPGGAGYQGRSPWLACPDEDVILFAALHQCPVTEVRRKSHDRSLTLAARQRICFLSRDGQKL